MKDMTMKWACDLCSKEETTKSDSRPPDWSSGWVGYYHNFNSSGARDLDRIFRLDICGDCWRTTFNLPKDEWTYGTKLNSTPKAELQKPWWKKFFSPMSKGLGK